VHLNQTRSSHYTPKTSLLSEVAASTLSSTHRGAPLSYSRTISSSSISISSKTTGLLSPSRHHRAFCRRSVAVTPSIALALAPSIACRRHAVRRRRAAAAATPPPHRRHSAATAATVQPFVGWLLRCCPPSDFVIAFRHDFMSSVRF
jgi:hypothetical protein